MSTDHTPTAAVPVRAGARSLRSSCPQSPTNALDLHDHPPTLCCHVQPNSGQIRIPLSCLPDPWNLPIHMISSDHRNPPRVGTFYCPKIKRRRAAETASIRILLYPGSCCWERRLTGQFIRILPHAHSSTSSVRTDIVLPGTGTINVFVTVPCSRNPKESYSSRRIVRTTIPRWRTGRSKLRERGRRITSTIPLASEKEKVEK